MTFCYIDIETIPEQPEESAKKLISETISAPATMKKAETIAEWHNGVGKYAGVKDAAIEEAYRKTSFDGAKGEIISIAWAIDNGDIKSMSRSLGESEADLLNFFFVDLVHFLNGNNPFFIGHYISGFDLKFLFHRCVINGVMPPFKIPFIGRHDKDYYDTMIAWAGYKDRISQDNLCRALGIEGKPDGIDGSKVWDFAKAGKIQEIEEYNRDDVDKVRQIYKKLNFIG